MFVAVAMSSQITRIARWFEISVRISSQMAFVHSSLFFRMSPPSSINFLRLKEGIVAKSIEYVFDINFFSASVPSVPDIPRMFTY